MADPHIFFNSQPAADLFGTPVLNYEIINNMPRLFMDFRFRLFAAAIVSHLLRLPGTMLREDRDYGAIPYRWLTGAG